MTSRIHRPEHTHPQPYQQECNREASKEMNWGLADSHPENENPRTGHDVTDVQRLHCDFPDDVLKQIPLLPVGTRLETDATYLNLKDPRRQPFSGDGRTEVGPGEWIVPKTEVAYPRWNRLLGITDVARTGGV